MLVTAATLFSARPSIAAQDQQKPLGVITLRHPLDRSGGLSRSVRWLATGNFVTDAGASRAGR